MEAQRVEPDSPWSKSWLTSECNGRRTLRWPAPLTRQSVNLTTRDVIVANAKQLRGLFQRIGETFRAEPHGPEHQAAAAEFHSNYDRLAFPGGLEQAMDKLGSCDPGTIAAAVDFLEIDPSFHRSGYIKEDILRRLKRCEIDVETTQRLAQLIIRSLDSGPRRVAQAYARLGATVHPPELSAALPARLASDDPEIRRRTEELLHVLQSAQVIDQMTDADHGS